MAANVESDENAAKKFPYKILNDLAKKLKAAEEQTHNFNVEVGLDIDRSSLGFAWTTGSRTTLLRCRSSDEC